MFDKKEMQITVPYEANTQDDEEEHGETDTRKLYNKFTDLMDKDRMNIVYHKPGNVKDTQKEGAEWCAVMINWWLFYR